MHGHLLYGENKNPFVHIFHVLPSLACCACAHRWETFIRQIWVKKDGDFLCSVDYYNKCHAASVGEFTTAGASVVFEGELHFDFPESWEALRIEWTCNDSNRKPHGNLGDVVIKFSKANGFLDTDAAVQWERNKGYSGPCVNGHGNNLYKGPLPPGYIQP